MTKLITLMTSVGADMYLIIYISVSSDEYGWAIDIEIPNVDLKGHEWSTVTTGDLVSRSGAGAEGINLHGVVSLCRSVVVGHIAYEASWLKCSACCSDGKLDFTDVTVVVRSASVGDGTSMFKVLDGRREVPCYSTVVCE